MAQPLPLRHLMPRGRVVRPEDGIPVIATVRWGAEGAAQVLAHATAWTAEAVEISWIMPGTGARIDWVPVADISRTAGRAAVEPYLARDQRTLRS